MHTPFCLAVAQSPAELATPRERLAWLRDALPDVAARKTDLLLLPELFVTGYNIGDQIVERSEPADGPSAKAISELAKAHGLAIHYGYAEACRADIFNAAQCFGPDGKRLGGHRKLAIPPGFEADYFTSGKGCSLFEYKGLRIGTLICYDAEFPETARHVASLGADLILVPTALGEKWGWVANTMIPTRAYENGVFLAYANSSGCENGLNFLGQSFICAPDGEELARAGGSAELIHADLDLARVRAAQRRLPYLDDIKVLKADIL